MTELLCVTVVALHASVLRPGKATCMADSNRHLETTAELLAHHICQQFPEATKTDCRVIINGHGSINASPAVGIVLAFIGLGQF